MPRRRRRFDPLPLPASASVRRALRDARASIVDVAIAAARDDRISTALRDALAALEQEVRIAIVLVDELGAPPIALARARALAIAATRRLDAVLAIAYEDRLAPTRRVLAACCAVARLGAVLYAIPIDFEASPWN